MQSICRHCQQKFEVTTSDMDFYAKVSPVFSGKKYMIPPPTLCPECRMQRRLAFINVHNLYKNQYAGQKEYVISPFSSEKNLNVLPKEEWFSDDVDARNIGQEFDFSKQFSQQFPELQQKAPRWDRYVESCENCDWSLNIANCKDCYLSRSCMDSECCLFSDKLDRTFNAMDSYLVRESENCYEILEGEKCFSVSWSEKIRNCRDSMFLYDCDHLSNCIGCVGIQHKQFFLLNQQSSPEEIKIISEKILSDSKFRKGFLKKFEHLKLQHPRRNLLLIQTENCFGDEILHSRNVRYGFSVRNSEDSSYVDFASHAKNCYDCSQPDIAELCYETSSTYQMYNSHFCYNSTHLTNCLYCETCVQLENCFGCVGLKNAKYCILNKQYSKEEYEKLVPKIIEHMSKISPNPSLKKRGTSPFDKGGSRGISEQRYSEWGEFFPIALSPFAYNETVAQEYFPLTKQDIETKNLLSLQDKWKWKDPEEPDFSGITKKIPAEKLPDSINDIPDDILNWAIECEQSKRLFKIQKPELEFYRKMNLPIPRLHPDVRHEKRMQLRNPRTLFRRNCDKCAKEIETTYSPERPEVVYCEACYLQEVY